MDPVKVEKFRARKNYKKKNHFDYNLVLHFLAALICSLLWSYPYLFPSLCFSMEHFCLISLPYIWSSFFNPKCLFVVVNVIVIFLVGESKLASSSSSPAGDDIYNEYVERSRSLRRVVSTSHEKSMTTKEEKVEEEKEVEHIIKEVNKVENKQEEEEEKENYEEVETVEEDDEEKEGEGEEGAVGLPLTLVEGEDEERRDKKEEAEEEEEDGLPTEELNKKVEDFIARVNKQRWLEVNS